MAMKSCRCTRTDNPLDREAGKGDPDRELEMLQWLGGY